MLCGGRFVKKPETGKQRIHHENLYAPCAKPGIVVREGYTSNFFCLTPKKHNFPELWVPKSPVLDAKV